MLEPNASVLGGEVPIGFGVVNIAVVLPSGGFHRGHEGAVGLGRDYPALPPMRRATAGVARCLRLKTASKPSSTNCLRTR